MFGDSRERAIHAAGAGAMAHGMELEITKRDFLHFAVGRMVVDPVLVAAKTIPRMQHRRMLVGDPRQFIQPAARQLAETLEMRLEPAKIIPRPIQREQIAQAAIHGIEILTRAIRCDVISAAAQLLHFNLVERFARWKRVHGCPCSRSGGWGPAALPPNPATPASTAEY